ncbi:hypothetical protein [Jeongeupia naejangsanensis]|uniref:Terminase small subunit n=1 Tax=Jeongeupia naejangsanensis TaxID=613195 RepID=A0ABS2BF85_9NEIS|nr:hypothetical protein [Jeongeupia naejangsanensis]MBM3114269.1 hypothetical protein [Jeongeupia naejangsanensis]
MEALTKSAFAKLRGYSRAYVTQLGNAGRLVLDDEGLVLVAESDRLIAATADPSRARRKAAPRKDWNSVTADTGLPDFQTVRTQNEIKRGVQLDIEIAEALKQLVAADEVALAVADIAGAVRAALERLPDRLSMPIAAETDPGRVYDLLDREITLVIEEVHRLMTVLPEQNEEAIC